MADTNKEQSSINISKTFLPRRGNAATMATIKAGVVLCEGEMFVEYPNSGLGTIGSYRIKFGDGKTPYHKLPYAFGDAESEFLDFEDITGDVGGDTGGDNESDGSTSFEEAMNNIKSGSSIGTIVVNVKAALYSFYNEFDDHSTDTDIHITAEEREIWTNATVATEASEDLDLDLIVEPGIRLYANTGNMCRGKPRGVDAFGMETFTTSTGHVAQELTEDNRTPGRKWIRIFNGAGWSNWQEYYTSANKQTTIDSSTSALNDLLGQQIDSTYLKRVNQSKRQDYVDLPHGDRERVVQHNFTATKGDSTETNFSFKDENTQYQMHIKNASNNDGSVNVELTSTDNTSNQITLKGDMKGSKVTSKNDVVEVNTEYDVTTEPHIMEDGTSNGVDIVLTDINGNRKVITFRSTDETRVSCNGDREINFYLPDSSMERCVTVQDDIARLALTRNDVQNGDTVKVLSTQIMHLVINDSVLGTEDAFTSYISYSATRLRTARTIDGVDFDGTAAINHFNTCATADGTAAKVVACQGFKLVTGARVIVKFSATDTAGNCTLNVNNTGARNIQIGGVNIKPRQLEANCLYEFIYTGSVYEMVTPRCLYFDGGDEG